jgi:hypothetical protein
MSGIGILLLGCFTLGVAPLPRMHTLTPEQAQILASWLRGRRDLRVATVADCQCPGQIARMKAGYGGDWPSEPPVPDYDPYSVRGDFNGDGFDDFAVCLLDERATGRRFAIAVFNGPFRAKGVEPAFFEDHLDLEGQGFFFGPPRPKPYRLVLGPFESDSGGLLEPKGGTYVWDQGGEPE